MVRNQPRRRGRLCSGMRLALALLLAVALSFSIAGPANADAPAPTQATATFEVSFMQNMIDHHQMAIMMAEMCVAKAMHDQLRGLCQTIASTQMAEIDNMQSWLDDWYGIDYEPAMRPGHMAMMDRLAGLSGAAFEVAFMEMMIKHHTRAIRAAEKCLDKAYHGELLALCQDIVDTQRAEIAQLRTWLCEWYDECAAKGSRSARSAHRAAPLHR